MAYVAAAVAVLATVMFVPVVGIRLGAPAAKITTVPLREYVSVFSAPGPGGRSRRKIHVTEYYGTVGVGTPPQFFDMVFDTGSGNVVLPTAKCVDEVCTQHRRFQGKASKTVVELAFEDESRMTPGESESDRDTTTITYGTGKLTGDYVRDSLCVGGNQSGEVCTTSDFLGVKTESRFPFIELPFDGIFGLGLEGLSVDSGFNFVNRLRNSSAGSAVFAYFLRDLQAEEDSEISFGGYLPERLSAGETMHWLTVPKEEALDKGYWLVTMKELRVGERVLDLCSDQPAGEGVASGRCRVAMDTGSAMMMAPRNWVGPLMEAIGMRDDCSNVKQLPTLSFVFDAGDDGTENFTVTLSAADYAEVSQPDGDEPQAGTPLSCGTAFAHIDLPSELGPFWVFGQTVLRKYYTVYDAARWRLGVGVAKHTAKRRWEPRAPAAPHPSVPQEPCQDDDKDIQATSLPGCKSFAKMGYCKRFAPLAQHYCRRSCALCVAPVAPQATSRTALAAISPHGATAAGNSGIKVAREEQRTLPGRGRGDGGLFAT